MKTLRKALIDRHRRRQAALERVRLEVLDQICPASGHADTVVWSGKPDGWIAWVCACRWAWVGIGGIWMAILFLQATMPSVSSEPQRSFTAYASPEVREQLKTQRELLAELLDREGSEEMRFPATRPRRPSLDAGGPRSERIPDRYYT